MSKLIPLLETLFNKNGGTSDLWKLILNVLNSNPEESKYFTTYLKMKIRDLSEEIQLLALDLLDFIVAEGKMPVWIQVAASDFFICLIGILKTRDAIVVHLKILYLIKKWGIRFESCQDLLPNFFEKYNGLKNAGIIFPSNYNNEGYKKYFEIKNGNQDQVFEIKKNSNKIDFDTYSYDFDRNEYVSEIHSERSEYYIGNIKLDLNPNNYDKKYSDIIKKIGVCIENINLANKMLDNEENDTQMGNSLKVVLDQLRKKDDELLNFIQKDLNNEKLLEILLGVNDDIQRTFMRYEIVKVNSKPEPFRSAFLEEKFSSSNIYMTNKSNKRIKMYTNENPIISIKNNTNIVEYPDLNLNTYKNIKLNSNQNKNKSESTQIKSVNDIFNLFGTSNNESSKNDKQVTQVDAGFGDFVVPNMNIDANKGLLNEKLKNAYNEKQENMTINEYKMKSLDINIDHMLDKPDQTTLMLLSRQMNMNIGYNPMININSHCNYQNTIDLTFNKFK